MLRGLIDVITDDVAARHPGVCATCLWELLDGRREYLDQPWPRRWRAGDVAAVLELAATRLVDGCDLHEHTAGSLRGYLTDLRDTGTFHPGSARPALLLTELQRHATTFRTAATDRSRWRLAKTLYAAMRADGIAALDQEGTDAWAAAFSRHSPAERAALLGHLVAAEPYLLTAEFFAADGLVGVLSPDPSGERTMTSVEALEAYFGRPQSPPGVADAIAALNGRKRATAAAVARDSELVAQLLAVSRWLVGRKTTTAGEPVPPDVTALAQLTGEATSAQRPRHLPEVPVTDRLLRIAVDLALVVPGTPRWTAGPRLPDDGDVNNVSDDDVLDLWAALLTLLSQHAWARPAATAAETSALDAGAPLGW